MSSSLEYDPRFYGLYLHDDSLLPSTTSMWDHLDEVAPGYQDSLIMHMLYKPINVSFDQDPDRSVVCVYASQSVFAQRTLTPYHFPAVSSLCLWTSVSHAMWPETSCAGAMEWGTTRSVASSMKVGKWAELAIMLIALCPTLYRHLPQPGPLPTQPGRVGAGARVSCHAGGWGAHLSSAEHRVSYHPHWNRGELSVHPLLELLL